MKKFAIILMIFSLNQSYAGKMKISQLKDKISNQSSTINKLAAEIRDVEEKMALSNEDYLKKIKDIESKEKNLQELKYSLTDSSKMIHDEYLLSQKALNEYLLEASDTDNDQYLISKKLYSEVLMQKMKDLKSAEEESEKILASIKKNENDLSEMKNTEQNLYALMLELESKKKDIGTNYLTLKEKHDKNQTILERELSRIRAKKVVKAQPTKTITNELDLIGFQMPITKFSSIKNGKKGITFKFSETTPVKSPAAGKIVYSGELASYGKVVMVDHGDDVRSVLLGDIISKVKKGDSVQAGEMIGYTVSDPGLTKSLYFEIRKKNIAQDTSMILSKNENKINKKI